MFGAVSHFVVRGVVWIAVRFEVFSPLFRLFFALGVGVLFGVAVSHFVVRDAVWVTVRFGVLAQLCLVCLGVGFV